MVDQAPGQACRSCRAPLPGLLLDLGAQPVADALLQEEDLGIPEPTYPLGVTVCTECWLLQLGPFDAVPGVSTWHGHGSVYSTTASAHEQRWAEELISELGIDHRWRVVEIGSGHGTLIRHFAKRGARVLGIEADATAAAAARDGGIQTICSDFDVRTAQQLVQQGWSADLLLANHALPHVNDLAGFLAGIATLLAPDGMLSTEFIHALEMVQQAQFDLVCHAHRCYFSVTALIPALGRHDLMVVAAKEVEIHGGSVRVLACHSPKQAYPDGSAESLLEHEQVHGLKSLQIYRSLSDRAPRARAALLRFLYEAKQAGRSVVAYGAPSRGSTLLNYCELTSELVAFTVDRSPAKQGRYLPGSRLRILPPESLDEARPDYVLILPWTLGDEIMQQLDAIRSWGGRFVLPLPTVTVVN